VKPYYQDEWVTIYHGDCREILPSLGKVDLVVTSPPYNFDMGYSGFDDNQEWGSYYNWLDGIFRQVTDLLVSGGRIALNIQPLFSCYQPTHRYISSLLEKHLLWKGEILWEKNNYNCKYTAWGSWKSPSNPYLKYTWEFIEIFCKGTYKKQGNPEYIDITADEFKKWTTAKWNIAPEKRGEHPAVMPQELAYRLLRLFSYQHDTILDPFNGIGTTTLVAKKLNRKCIGIELEEKYCEIAAKRCSQSVMRLDI